MAINKKSREYIICPCRQVTRGQVEDIIREQKITDLKTLCQAANAGNKCGSCREELDMVLTEILQEG